MCAEDKYLFNAAHYYYSSMLTLFPHSKRRALRAEDNDNQKQKQDKKGPPGHEERGPEALPHAGEAILEARARFPRGMFEGFCERSLVNL